ncbi:VOC family protein [Chitinophaga oryzae]|uniref:VOC family protein n=1 Tax=Chitinophaga oryzae TaxID=2725414 RepID=A0ABX6LHC9_9BACT|nr:VOC family protein [Chitinophaga oryzae]QJB38273.1 VOC family protein [Chitinophaga oryzae]
MRAIENIAVPVTDQQLSKQFYLLLGFELLAEVMLPDGDAWIQLGFRNQVTTISLVRQWPYGRMQAGALQGLVLETDNIIRERERLHREGVNVSAISESAFGKVFFLQDPDLNGLSIHEFSY